MYDLSPKVLDHLEYDKTGFKKFLKANGGIRVYRDKVRVYDYGEPGNDWLNLDYKRLTSPTQAISNNQILGAIYLDREFSSDLIEKTNREGFLSNLAFETFVKSILIALEKISQERVIDKTIIKDTYGVNNKSEPVISTIKDLDKYIEINISDKNPAKRKIREKLIEIEREYTNITENLLTAAGSGLSLNIAVHEIEKIINELIKKVNEDNLDKELSHLINNLHTTLKHYAEMSKFHKNENISLKNTISSAIDLNVYRLYSHNIEVINNSTTIIENINIKFTNKLLLATISNLFDNSIYWLDDKEHYLNHDENSIFKKKIYIDLIIENNIPSIIIADNGFGFKIGTDMAKKPYITKRDGSMGLGLYIIDETMKMHKGKLLFPDKGDIELPEEFKSGAVIQLKFEKRV
jgi:signal transduction histidine kinase